MASWSRATAAREMGDSLDVVIEVLDDGKRVNKLEDVRLKVAPRLSFRDASLDNFGEVAVGAERRRDTFGQGHH